MFYKNEQKDPTESLQIILLDARSGRDPTYLTYGSCRGADSKMLTDKQWDWLDKGYSKYFCDLPMANKVYGSSMDHFFDQALSNLFWNCMA